MRQPKTFGEVRVTPSSITGRKLMKAKGSIFTHEHEKQNTHEQEDWNSKVEMEKKERKSNNLLKRL